MMENSSSSKSFSTRRAPKTGNSTDKAKEEKEKLAEAAILAALEEEILAANPLNKEQVAQLDKYCGAINMP